MVLFTKTFFTPLFILVFLLVPMPSALSQTYENEPQTSGKRGGPPQGFYYGVGLIIPHNLYEGKNSKILPIPMIGYMGDRLQIFGPNVSYTLFRENGFSIIGKLSGRFDGFSPDNSEALQGMNKRSSSADAGVGLKYEVSNWTGSLNIATDILGKSNGTEVDVEFNRKFATPQFNITPSIGVSWQDAKLVDYYYGVRASEVTADRGAYSGKSATNYFVGLATSKQAFAGSIRLNLGLEFYDNAITDSPLVNKNKGFDTFLSYSRFF